jgi:hypothetical protein
MLAAAARLYAAVGQTSQAVALWTTLVREHAASPEAPGGRPRVGARAQARRGQTAARGRRLEHLILTYPESALVAQPGASATASSMTANDSLGVRRDLPPAVARGSPRLAAALLCAPLPRVAPAQWLLVPMDDDQQNHLKAYGLTYNALKAGLKAEWLLNYRGGAFLLPDTPTLRRIAALGGVSASRRDRRRR